MNKKLFVLIFCLVLLVAPLLSAFEFDNIKNYDEKTQTIDLRNSILGIPFLQLSKIAEVQLITPRINSVIRGEDRLVAEFRIVNYKDYKEGAFDNLEFYNIKKSMAQFDREFVYRYKEFYDIEVIEYETICKEREIVLSNGSHIEKYDCYQNQIGSHPEKEFNWIDFNDQVDLKKGNITIGIFTDVLPNEHIEWIPTLFGVEINEWAVWTEGLSVGLKAYWNFDDASLNDSLGNLNLTIFGDPTYRSSGKLNGYYEYDGTGDWLNSTDAGDMGLPNGTDPSTICMWANITDNSASNIMLSYGTQTTSHMRSMGNYNATGLWYFSIDGYNAFTSSGVSTDKWHHICSSNV